MQDASQAAAPGAPGPAPSPAGPVRVSSGHLRGIDHSARGEASIIRRPDGSHVVRLSNFDIQSSPDPIVYVIEGENRDNPGGADLGRLRGSVGTDSDYELPRGTDPGPGLCGADRQRHASRGVTYVSLLRGRKSAGKGLTDTDGYRILTGIGYHSVSMEAPMNDLKTSAPPAITPIGKREAQAWLVKQLGYERLLASLRKAHAEQQAHEPQRDVAA